MNSKTKKQLLSLLVSLAMAASVSFTPVYADDEEAIQATIEIPTGSNAEGSYTYEVSSDGTSTVSETSGNSNESGSDENAASETSGDSSESSNADSGATEAAAESTDETTETADGTETTDSAASSDAESEQATETEATEQEAVTEQTDTAEQETAAPAEEATAAPVTTTVGATATETSAVEKVQALIEALPSVSSVANMDSEEQNEVYTDFLAACDAYDALSEEEQEQVDDSKLYGLSDYFNGLISAADTVSTDSAEELTGVTATITPDYVSSNKVYSWDFSTVNVTPSSSTMYNAGNGLYVYLNSHGALNKTVSSTTTDEDTDEETTSATYNGIYANYGNWVPETNSSGVNNPATQYIVFVAPETGTFTFTAYFSSYSSGNAAHRIYCETGTTIPSKNTDNKLWEYNSNGSTHTTGIAETATINLDVTSGRTYCISVYRGTTAESVYTALYDFTFTVSDSTLTPISGSFSSDTYTWDFASTGAVSSATTFDYSDTFAAIRVGLGRGDSLIANDGTVTDYGIHFSEKSVGETDDNSGYANLGDTNGNRYIMITPTVSGKINITYRFTAVPNGTNACNRMYYAEYDKTIAGITLTDVKKGSADNSRSSGNCGDIKETTAQTYTLDVTKGYTYVFYTYQRASYISSMTYTPTIVTGKNIDLTSGEIVMNVYVDSDVINTSGTANSTAYYNKPEITTDTGTDGNTVSIVSQKILASEMADNITLTIPLKDGGTYTYTTSVKDYATEALTSATDEQKKVINAMLDYGSAVQMLADSTLESTSTTLANSGTWQTSNINGVDSTSLANANTGATKKSSTNDNSEWSGAKLSSMNMNFNYNFNLGMTYSDSLGNYTVKVTLDNTEYTVTEAAGDTIDSTTDKVVFSSDKQSIIIKDLSAADLLSALSISLTPNDTSSSTTIYTTTTKPIYYARLLVTSGTESQKLLGQTLYLYAKAVNDLAS